MAANIAPSAEGFSPKS